MRSTLAAAVLMVFLSAQTPPGGRPHLEPARIYPRLEKIDQAVTALGGVLTLRVPSGMADSRPAPDLMSAPLSDSERTMYRLEDGDETLTVYVRQLWMKTAGNFEAELRDYLADDPELRGAQLDPVRLKQSGLKALRVTPIGGPPRIRDLHLIDLVYVASADAFVQELRVYANNIANLRGVNGYHVRGIAESLAPGKHPRSKRTNKGTVQIDTWPGERLSVSLPKDAIHFVEVGPDFRVLRIQLVATLGKSRGAMGMYLGDHASFDGATPTGRWTTILGQKVEWMRPSKGAGLTTLVSLPERGREVHLWIHGESARDERKLLRIARSLKRVRISAARVTRRKADTRNEHMARSPTPTPGPRRMSCLRSRQPVTAASSAPPRRSRAVGRSLGRGLDLLREAAGIARDTQILWSSGRGRALDLTLAARGSGRRGDNSLKGQRIAPANASCAPGPARVGA